MVRKKKKTSTFILFLVFLIGFTILSYPFVSNWFATRQGVEVARGYQAMTSALSDEDIKEEWEKAEVYNEHLRGDPVKDPFVWGSGVAVPSNYRQVLNIDGVMCYIEIPEISVKLPIYHGVSEEVLDKGIGHIESTAFPIGSMGGHTVLTGHTGLPTAKLFTDLIELEKGDLFYIHVLGKMLVYEIDQMKVIVPEDLSDLVEYEDKDYITLLTCTPYGVNSHRLLVRGERVFNYSRRVSTLQDILIFIMLFCSLCVLILIFLIRFILILKKIKQIQKKKEDTDEKKNH